MSRPVVLVFGTGQLGMEISNIPAAELDVKVFGRDRVDVTNAAHIDDAIESIRPAAVVNCTGYTAVDRAESDQATAFAINRDAPAAMATSCARRNTPFVHVSTDYVFDGSNGPYGESASPAPQSVYGASKLAGERAVSSHCERHLIFRTAWLFSAFGSNFVKTMLRLGTEKNELRVVDDQQGCPTPASALAHAILSVADRAALGENLPWGTYHFAGTPATTWRRFAEHIFARANALAILGNNPRVIPVSTAEYPTAARRPANSALNCSLLSRLALAQPDWRDGLDVMLGAIAKSKAMSVAQ